MAWIAPFRTETDHERDRQVHDSPRTDAVRRGFRPVLQPHDADLAAQLARVHAVGTTARPAQLRAYAEGRSEGERQGLYRQHRIAGARREGHQGPGRGRCADRCRREEDRADRGEDALYGAQLRQLHARLHPARRRRHQRHRRALRQGRADGGDRQDGNPVAQGQAGRRQASVSHGNRRWRAASYAGGRHRKRAMSYKAILVHCDASPKLAHRLDVAVELAQRHRAHLIGVHVQPPFDIPAFFDGPVPTTDLYGAFEAAAKANQESAIAAFNKAIKGSELSTEWRLARGYPENELAVQGRYADLLILGQTEPDAVTQTPSDLPEAVALSTGRPTLVVPH